MLLSDVGWFHGSEAIKNDNKYWTYRTKESHFLTIFNTNKSDCGKFNLVAFNGTGEIWHSFNLLVRGISVYMLSIYTVSSNACVQALEERNTPQKY